MRTFIVLLSTITLFLCHAASAMTLDYEAIESNKPCRAELDNAPYRSANRLSPEKYAECMKARKAYYDKLPVDYFINKREDTERVWSTLTSFIPVPDAVSKIPNETFVAIFGPSISTWLEDTLADLSQNDAVNEDILNRLMADYEALSQSFIAFDDTSTISVETATQAFGRYKDAIARYEGLLTQPSLTDADKALLGEFVDNLKMRQQLVLFNVTNKANADFYQSTNLKMKEMMEAINGNSLTLQSLSGDIRILRNRQDEMFEKMRQQEDINKAMRDYHTNAAKIKDYQHFANAMVGVASLVDPHFAKNIAKPVNAVFNFMSAYNRLKAIKANPALGSVLGPYGMMASAALSLLGSEQNNREEYENIMKALETISDQIIELHIAVNDGFKNVEERLYRFESRVMAQFIGVFQNQQAISEALAEIKDAIDSLSDENYIRSMAELEAKRLVFQNSVNESVDECFANEKEPEACFIRFRKLIQKFQTTLNVNFIGGENLVDQNRIIGERYYYHLAKYQKTVTNYRAAMQMPPLTGGPLEPVYYQYMKDLFESYAVSRDASELSSSVAYSNLSKTIARYDSQQAKFFESVRQVNERELALLYWKALEEFVKASWKKIENVERPYELFPRYWSFSVKSCDPESDDFTTVDEDVLRANLFPNIFVNDLEGQPTKLQMCYILNRADDFKDNLILNITLPHHEDITFTASHTYSINFENTTPCREAASDGSPGAYTFQCVHVRDYITNALFSITDQIIPRKDYEIAFDNYKKGLVNQYRREMLKQLEEGKRINDLAFIIRMHEYIGRNGVNVPPWVFDRTLYLTSDDINYHLYEKLVSLEFDSRDDMDELEEHFLSLLEKPSSSATLEPLISTLDNYNYDCSTPILKDDLLTKIVNHYKVLQSEPYLRSGLQGIMQRLHKRLRDHGSKCLAPFEAFLEDEGLVIITNDYRASDLRSAFQFYLDYADHPFRYRLLNEHIDIIKSRKRDVLTFLAWPNMPEELLISLYTKISDDYKLRELGGVYGYEFSNLSVVLLKNDLITRGEFATELANIQLRNTTLSLDIEKPARATVTTLVKLYKEGLFNEDYVNNVTNPRAHYRSFLKQIRLQDPSENLEFTDRALRLYFYDWIRTWTIYKEPDLQQMWTSVEELDDLFDLLTEKKATLIASPMYIEKDMELFIYTIENAKTKLNLKNRRALRKMKKAYVGRSFIDWFNDTFID